MRLYKGPGGELPLALPEGYVPLEKWIAGHPEASDEEIHRNVRWLSKKIAFILDENHPENVALAEKYRKDSNELKMSIEAELRERNVNITVKKAKNGRKGMRKMAFLIRGTYIPAYPDTINEENRMQGGQIDRDYFVLHFDAKQKCRGVRFWKPKTGDIEQTTELRKFIVEMIYKTTRDFLNEEYGNWEIIAKRIVDIIEKGMEMKIKEAPAVD
ncbi:hypothetical protein KJ632_00325, partial [Patescibacteria group bacterium]|nr:hypothetical protein [Patescibacteria group bacterium]